MQCAATIAALAPGGGHTATIGVEPRARYGRRYQSFRRADDLARVASGVDLWPKQTGIVDRDACGRAAAPPAVYSVHRPRRVSISYAQAADGPQAAGAPEPSPVTPVS